jgi:hypothetical protein
MSAEEWPVCALGEDYNALKDLSEACKPGGISRHAKLACIIFNLDLQQFTSNPKYKKTIEYYLGKKSRHANNYGLQPPRFSNQCASEGFAISVDAAKMVLAKVNEIDWRVDKVFHEYIKAQLLSTRTLRTPLGRERVFFGLRSNDKNYEIFNKAYAYIPQSTVGDNTGLAILNLDSIGSQKLLGDSGADVNQESHDSVNNEINDNERSVLYTYRNYTRAFDRKIVFHNGVEIQIPIEGELGYDFENHVKIKEWSEDGVMAAYRELKEKYKNRELEYINNNRNTNNTENKGEALAIFSGENCGSTVTELDRFVSSAD